MKYYFISFMYGASEKTPANTVINEHPLKWQTRANQAHPGQYILITWKEITREEYIMYKD